MIIITWTDIMNRDAAVADDDDDDYYYSTVCQ